MRPTLEVYVNGDDALLRWGVDELDDRCLGFAVQRRRNGGEPAWLDNFAPPGPADHQRAVFEPSDVAQFRCFAWIDHPGGAGDTVSYRVMPVMARGRRRRRRDDQPLHRAPGRSPTTSSS